MRPATTGSCCRPGRATRTMPGSAWTWSAPAPARSRCSGSASVTRPSARCSAAWSPAPPNCSTARPRWCTTTAWGVLAGLPDPFRATRYHSLAVERGSIPAELEVTGWTDSGVVMALRHREFDIEGVQFHPESVLTEGGHRMLANWLARCGDPGAVARSEGMAPVVGPSPRPEPGDDPRRRRVSRGRPGVGRAASHQDLGALAERPPDPGLSQGRGVAEGRHRDGHHSRPLGQLGAEALPAVIPHGA